MVERGKVGTIIVKYLRHFARNYFESGNYIEVKYPSMGIHFIAMHENIDTAAGTGIEVFLYLYEKKHFENKLTNIRQIHNRISQAKQRIVSGWAKANAVPSNGDTRKFKISVKITYDDGYSVWQEPACFNHSISDWQFASSAFTLSDGDSNIPRTPVSVTICPRYQYQAYFAFLKTIVLKKITRRVILMMATEILLPTPIISATSIRSVIAVIILIRKPVCTIL